MRSPALSLRGRALQALAQREQSRVELRRKLLRHATKAAASARAERSGNGPRDDDDDQAQARAAVDVDRLLDALEREGLLSGKRFVESRVHAREGRFGNLRIRHELGQHALALSPEAAAALAASEASRAADVRERRFGAAPPEDASARARQARFLAARGFSPEVVRRLLRSGRPVADREVVAPAAVDAANEP